MRTLLPLLLGLLLALPPAQAASDIWPRIAAGMAMPPAGRAEVRYWIGRYAAQPTVLTQMLARGSPFLGFIVDSAEQRGLPMELTLLPAVESSFDPQARSVSAATGLWQFIPRTGMAYGLREDHSYDGRRDPVASTQAALSYLQSLHGEFGDWLLALAAYNAGPSRVHAAIAESGSRDFWALPLRQETRDYVPKLLALAALVREPARYGVRLPRIDRRGTELVRMDRRLSLHNALLAARVDQKLVRRFNPGLKQVSHRSGAPALLLPMVDALVMRAELAQAALNLGGRRPSATAPAPLLLAADLRPDPLGLRQVPRLSEAAPPATFASVAGAEMIVEPVAPPPVPDSAPPGGAVRQHRVQRGETLFAISRRYQVTVHALRLGNGLVEGDALNRGSLLQIPPSDAAE